MTTRHGEWARCSLGAWVLGAVLTVAPGCLQEDKHPQVVRVREVKGSIRVAEGPGLELRPTDTDQGLKVMTTGARIQLDPGARVRLELIDRKGWVYAYGPGELEVQDVRLERSSVHGKAEDVHASILLLEGVLAGASEGGDADRPSLAIATPRLSAQVERFGRWAVVVTGGEGWAEGWIRDERGPEQDRLLVAAGGAVEFPPLAAVMIDSRDPVAEYAQATQTVPRAFADGFLHPLVNEPRDAPDPRRLFDQLSWKNLSR